MVYSIIMHLCKVLHAGTIYNIIYFITLIHVFSFYVSILNP